MTQMKTKLQGLAVDYVVVLKQRILDNRIPVQILEETQVRSMSSSVLVSKSPAGSQTSKDWNSKILNLNHQCVKRELERWLSR